MSVLITVKFQGNTDTFRQALADRADEFVKVSDASRAVGAIHHRFAVGDDFVLVFDEWDSFEHFEQFFANPDLHAFIGSVGADPAPPEITVAEAVASPDQF
jgi:quinol monooxygenase YgiN